MRISRQRKFEKFQERVRYERLNVMKIWLMAIVLGCFGLTANRLLKLYDEGLLLKDITLVSASTVIGAVAIMIIWFYIIPSMEKE